MRWPWDAKVGTGAVPLEAPSLGLGIDGLLSALRRGNGGSVVEAGQGGKGNVPRVELRVRPLPGVGLLDLGRDPSDIGACELVLPSKSCRRELVESRTPRLKPPVLGFLEGALGTPANIACWASVSSASGFP